MIHIDTEKKLQYQRDYYARTKDTYNLRRQIKYRIKKLGWEAAYEALPIDTDLFEKRIC